MTLDSKVVGGSNKKKMVALERASGEDRDTSKDRETVADRQEAEEEDDSNHVQEVA